jgi:hypothetical protein
VGKPKKYVKMMILKTLSPFQITFYVVIQIFGALFFLTFFDLFSNCLFTIDYLYF